MMKRLYIWVLCLSGILLSACDVERSDNDDLDGFWQMQSIDSITNGHTADMQGRGIYWSIQKDLLEARVAKGDTYAVLFLFDYQNTTLRVYHPYMNDRDLQDVTVNDVAILKPLGINSLDEQFVIEQLGAQLVLRSSTLRLHFRRY